jgi:hypothetical protein
MKEFQNTQIVNIRNRYSAVAANILELNEMNRKIKARRKWDKVIKDVVDRIGQPDLISKYKEEYEACTGYDKRAIASYIHEHEKSSVIPGLKWKELEEELSDEAKAHALVEAILEWWRRMSKNTTMYFTRNYALGIRQRGIEAMTLFFRYVRPHIFVGGLIPRSRQVQFVPEFSMFNLPIINKKRLYKSIIYDAKDKYGLESPILCPLVEGGKIYPEFAKYIRNGEIHVAIDAKNHEACVPEILGDQMNCFATTLAGQKQEPSGTGFTSLLNTETTEGYVKDLEHEVGLFECVLVFGDDIHLILSSKNQMSKLKASSLVKAGILEMDQGDTAHNFVLGISLKPGAEGLRGLKLMQDRSDKMIGIPDIQDGSLDKDRTFDLDSTMRYFSMYPLHGRGGTINGRNIIDVLAEIEVEDFRGPGAMLEKLAED